MSDSNSEQKTIRKKYSSQFKDQALERSDTEGMTQVAKYLGLAESLLYSWRKQRNQCDSSLENQKFLAKCPTFPAKITAALRHPNAVK